MGKHARQRREKSANDIKLAHPDRSGPSEQTLLDLAQERNLFDQADRDPRNKNRIVNDSDDEEEEVEDGPMLSSTAERVMDTLLWVVSLSMGHFTFDFMVQYQYAQDIEIGAIAARTGQAFILFFFLFWFLHPHQSNPTLVPGLSIRHQEYLRTAIFFLMGAISGCSLIHITNEAGYLAVMKRAPTLGCLWLWAVIELPLISAVASLAVCGFFFWWGDYDLQ